MTAAAVAILSGCAAPTVTTHVTSFQQWPGNAAGQTYAFTPVPAEQATNLEYQLYRDTIIAGLSATGLVQAQPGATARFNVEYQYGVQPFKSLTRRPYDPDFYGGFYGPRRWRGPYWGEDCVDVPVARYRNWLNLQIHDALANGAEVFRSSVSLDTNKSDSLLRSMPYMVRALFDGFPGTNGQERKAQYPVLQ